VPVIAGGVNVILQGDDLPEAREIGPLDALELLMTEVAREMERALRPRPLLRTAGGPARIAP
jgi:hypothetical protein